MTHWLLLEVLASSPARGMYYSGFLLTFFPCEGTIGPLLRSGGRPRASQAFCPRIFQMLTYYDIATGPGKFKLKRAYYL